MASFLAREATPSEGMAVPCCREVCLLLGPAPRESEGEWWRPREGRGPGGEARVWLEEAREEVPRKLWLRPTRPRLIPLCSVPGRSLKREGRGGRGGGLMPSM